MRALVLATLLGSIGPAPSSGPASFQGSLLQLDRAVTDASDSVAPHVLQRLEDAIAAMGAFHVQLSTSASAREVLIMAHLSLARGYLGSGQVEAAEAVMDALIRGADPVHIPASRFGPDVDKLYRARVASLQARGKATLRVTCPQRCEVLVGWRAAGAGAIPLYLGDYEVLVTLPNGRSSMVVVSLTDPNTTTVFDAGSAPTVRSDAERSADSTLEGKGSTSDEPKPVKPEPVKPEPVVESPPPPEVVPEPIDRSPTPDDSGPSKGAERDPISRLLPRWVEVGGLVGGVGMAVAGPIMLFYDENCPNGSTETTLCPKIWETTTGGVVVTALGGALLVTSVVLLAVDERAAKRSRRSSGIRLDGLGLHF